MNRWLAFVAVVVSCIPLQLDAQSNPLWSEQKVKNFLPHMTWPEVKDLLSRTDMVLIPMPAMEQHGLHGPIGTDYYSGVEQSKLIAQRTDVLVAPIMYVGQSAYHLAFPGTIALSAETLQRVYFEAAQSLINQGFRRILLYASHTGNQHIASFVADRLNQETPAVAVTLADGVATMRPPAAAPSTSTQPVPFDRHGGVGESSGGLYLFPTLMQMEKAERATLSVPPGARVVAAAGRHRRPSRSAGVPGRSAETERHRQGDLDGRNVHDRRVERAQSARSDGRTRPPGVSRVRGCRRSLHRAVETIATPCRKIK